MEDAIEPKQLESWIKQVLKPQIASAEKTIQKAKSDIQTQVTSLNEVVSDLLEKSEKDSVEKRNDRAAHKAARAAGRMCLELQGLLSGFALGNPQSYEGLKGFSDASAKLANEAARTRDRWIGHIRPYYILDMMSLNASIDKMRRLGDHAWEIFSKEGSLLRRLEEIHGRAEKIDELEQSLQKQLDERDQLMQETKKLEPQISATTRTIETLGNNPKIEELRRIDSRLRGLRGELLTSGFRRLGRPLRKLEAMAGRGDYPIPPEVRAELAEYLKKPFTTFVREADGYPSLRSILGSLNQAVKRKKLVLKQREERKVLERIENVTERNVLDKIHREAKTLVAERRRCLQDPDCLELVRAYRSQKQELKNLELKRAELQHRSKVVSEKVQMLSESLAEFVKGTELAAERFSEKRVRIKTDLAGLSA
jgi:hypothetical protein